MTTASQAETVIIYGDVDTLIVVPQVTPDIIKATRRAPRIPRAKPAEQLALDTELTAPLAGFDIQATAEESEAPPDEYDGYSAEDKELADRGEALMEQSRHTAEAFVARNLRLQAMFPLIGKMNSMAGLSKNEVHPADTLVGAHKTQVTAEQNAKNLLAAACLGCDYIVDCRIKAFAQWTRVHPYASRVVAKDREISQAKRDSIEKQAESRDEFKNILKQDQLLTVTLTKDRPKL